MGWEGEREEEIVTTKRLAVKAFDLWSHPPHLAICTISEETPQVIPPNDHTVFSAPHLLTFPAAPISHSVISVKNLRDEKKKFQQFIDISNSY
ncbi:hypothetical protein CDAR_96121 [Caerostris darwini]|uniref:Uncharacterized protein n=1 Tax=Caerostris darwini TaxID=1538125 RepID=A0AAV4PTA0_9ARAC|nr:hypothetical protein CDAR_96121 [Caerostris darwini]